MGSSSVAAGRGEAAGPEQRFGEAFERWAGRIRRRALGSGVLAGAALGLLLGAVAAGALWKTRQGPLRPWAGLGGLGLGAAAGALWARRRRWDDQQVALYLDGRLGSHEAVTTALELRGQAGRAAAELVLAQATAALSEGDPKTARPPVWKPWFGAGPLAAGAIAYVCWLPLPAAPAGVVPPGADVVQLAEIKGLEKVEALARLPAADEEQRRRLDKIAQDAAALREKLRQGVERREALAEIARLQDAVQSERLSLGDGDRRQGMEAALARMAKEALLADAAKALGDRDLVRFDEEMQKLANSREKEDRERAKKALEEAASEARKQKADDVARALERQKELLEQRGQRADELRALADALKGSVPDEVRREMAQQGVDGKDARKAARAMEDALKKLSPEERKRLADNLKKRMSRGDMAPSTEQRLRELAKGLDSEEGKKQLEDELRRLANDDADNPDADQQEGLDDAQRGLGQMQGELGATPVPMDGPGQGGDKGGQGKGQKGDGKGQKGDGKGEQGDGKGDGKGQGDGDNQGDGSPGGDGSKPGQKIDHKGQSKDVDAPELRARAKAKMDGRAPSAGVTLGRSAGREGDTANRQGTGALGKVGPGEVNGVDANEVPEEYREQVGRYFQP